MIHDTKRIRIRQSRNETNLFGVRIRDYDTNPRFYESLIRIPHPYLKCLIAYTMIIVCLIEGEKKDCTALKYGLA